jgi:glutathione synthase/RimK-type ligase-like ATP-grasp enzyme
MATQKPIAIYYEHPEWFRALFEELDRRGTPYVTLDASRHSFDPAEAATDYALLFNRMSASAYLRGHGNAIFYTRYFLAHLERAGVRVVNGHDSFIVETSKAAQLVLLESLGLPYPRTRVINHPSEAARAAQDLRFPVIVKPNIGGRGAGVTRFDSPGALALAAEDGRLELGVDSTALVQEFIPARGGHITRVETLAGKFLYAIKVYTTGESFNLCPAEICQIEREEESRVEGQGSEKENAIREEAGARLGPEDAARLGPESVGQQDFEICLVDAPKKGLVVEAYTPPREIVEAVERVAAGGKLDLGGVEYIVDDRDGQVYFYDINALSNFVADAESIVGFDPHARLVDFLEEEARRCDTATGSLFSAAG